MASVASQLIEEVTAHAQSDSLEDAREICADGTYLPNNLCVCCSCCSQRPHSFVDVLNITLTRKLSLHASLSNYSVSFPLKHTIATALTIHTMVVCIPHALFIMMRFWLMLHLVCWVRVRVFHLIYQVCTCSCLCSILLQYV